MVRPIIGGDMGQRGWLIVVVTILSQLVDISAGKTVDVVLSDYHNYTQLMDELDTLVESYGELSRLYILGATISERDIPVIQISQGVREVRNCICSGTFMH